MGPATQLCTVPHLKKMVKRTMVNLQVNQTGSRSDLEDAPCVQLEGRPRLDGLTSQMRLWMNVEDSKTYLDHPTTSDLLSLARELRK